MKLPIEIEKQINEMPMLSEVAHKLMLLTSDPDHSLRDVEKIVETDVYLASRIMMIANSAMYSRGKEITSVQRAIMHLGEAVIIGVAIGVSTGNTLTKPMHGYGGPEGSLWAHCLQSGIAAREVARLTGGRVDPDQAYTAGLLLDIGMALLSDHIGDKITEMVKEVDSGNVHDYLEAEQQSFQTDHAIIGSKLSSKWNLPESLKTAILYHHRPSEAPEEFQPLVYVVHVADLVARMSGFGVGSESLSYKMDEGYKQFIPFNRKNLEAIMLTVMEEFSKIEEFIMTT